MQSPASTCSEILISILTHALNHNAQTLGQKKKKKSSFTLKYFSTINGLHSPMGHKVS